MTSKKSQLSHYIDVLEKTRSTDMSGSNYHSWKIKSLKFIDVTRRQTDDKNRKKSQTSYIFKKNMERINTLVGFMEFHINIIAMMTSTFANTMKIICDEKSCRDYDQVCTLLARGSTNILSAMTSIVNDSSLVEYFEEHPNDITSLRAIVYKAITRAKNTVGIASFRIREGEDHVFHTVLSVEDRLQKEFLNSFSLGTNPFL